MRNIITIAVLLLLNLGAYAQNFQNNITVNGTHKFVVEPEYSAKMIVSLTSVYYDVETITLAEIKGNYLDKLVNAGLSKSDLKENEWQYAIVGYDKAGTVIEFKTTSKEKMKTFLSTKSMGVTKSDSKMEATLTDEQLAEYGEKAFNNAKAKAEKLAQKIGRKIGKAIYISDTNRKEISEQLYYTSLNVEREYSVSVSFELL